MHLRLWKCEKLPQNYRKLTDSRLPSISCSFTEFAVAELSLNLQCPALVVTLAVAQRSGYVYVHVGEATAG